MQIETYQIASPKVFKTHFHLHNNTQPLRTYLHTSIDYFVFLRSINKTKLRPLKQIGSDKQHKKIVQQK